MDALEITGTDAADFSVVDLEEPISLGLFESAEIGVVFFSYSNRPERSTTHD